MTWPQIIMATVLSFNVIAGALMHGRQASSYDFRDALISAVLLTALLWWGGFWA